MMSDAISGCIVLNQLSKNGDGLVFNLSDVESDKEQSFLVGRSMGCDFRLKSTEFPLFISRQHARITVCENKIYVTDLKSVNGTFVNDTMLYPEVKTELSIGDSIMFGIMSPYIPIKHGDKVTASDPIFKFLLERKVAAETKCDTVESMDNPKEISPDRKPDVIVPLTVQNLIENAGCNFTSTNKENEVPKRRASSRKRRKTFYGNRRTNISPEQCEYFNCKIAKIRRRSKVIYWVQCDKCDMWFHTECVGCDYKRVKSHKSQFSCGQC